MPDFHDDLLQRIDSRLALIETRAEDIVRRVLSIKSRITEGLLIESKFKDKLGELERSVMGDSIRLREGVQHELESVKDSVSELRRDLNSIQTKTSKWEGGGGVLYIVVTALGGFLGWLLSHLGIQK